MIQDTFFWKVTKHYTQIIKQEFKNLQNILIETRGLIRTTAHTTNFFRKLNYGKKFEEEGLNLYVYNPKSLLRKVLPIYKT